MLGIYLASQNLQIVRFPTSNHWKCHFNAFIMYNGRKYVKNLVCHNALVSWDKMANNKLIYFPACSKKRNYLFLSSQHGNCLVMKNDEFLSRIVEYGVHQTLYTSLKQFWTHSFNCKWFSELCWLHWFGKFNLIAHMNEEATEWPFSPINLC